MKQDVLTQLVSVPMVAVALLILYAGVGKFFYFKEFRASLLYVPYLPMPLVPAISIAIPILEVIAGSCLLFGMPLGIALTCGLLASTSAAAIVARARNQRVPCVCFTASGTDSLSLTTVARNAAFASITLLPVFLPVRLPDIDPLILVYAALAIFVYLSIALALKNAFAIRDIRRSV